MSLSSSAVARQPEPEAESPSSAPFPYADATLSEPAAEPVTITEDRSPVEGEIREQARQQGRQDVRAEMDAALAKEREQITRALEGFVAERQDYYRRIEGEVVQLALAVARKILHREVQVDPHALAGIVRITLEGMDAGTKVSLHVPPREAAEWRHQFASRMEGELAMEVREDATLAAGECRIDTALGTTAVGFESQLKEIETGLLDLLAERPGSS
jgi:flagellar assembly protein FliH